ncbi:hypothetical protein HanXRQr2_Chr02g0065081 [Helianthus annuus]|uniref:Uncharacterized protein n=1 Tax=Helianthus annuus TaxID=4232 RepID=A0A9K3JNP5_HELAN|nr:hypothetical protein HanXRQr2_Chr02g0065081 [Helianthus annuus]
MIKTVVLCTIPHIPAVIEDYKDLIPVIITLENNLEYCKTVDKKRMTHIISMQYLTSFMIQILLRISIYFDCKCMG